MDLSQVEVYNKEVAELRAQRDADYAEYEAAGRIWGLVPRERITKIKFFAAVLIKNDGKVFYMEITLDIVLLSL